MLISIVELEDQNFKLNKSLYESQEPQISLMNLNWDKSTNLVVVIFTITLWQVLGTKLPQ